MTVHVPAPAIAPGSSTRVARTSTSRLRPLQNRVDPFGDLYASEERGTLMGNRGGRFHDPETGQLRNRRWASQRWIACTLTFRDQARRVWGEGYTELFFLDEVTALAAGHRPCHLCRRLDALDFAASWAEGQGRAIPVDADEIDLALHVERTDGRDKRIHAALIDALPDGAVIVGNEFDRIAYAVKGDALLPWTPGGWGEPLKRTRGMIVGLLTPPSIIGALKAGYVPQWHASATDYQIN